MSVCPVCTNESGGWASDEKVEVGEERRRPSRINHGTIG
jgi:hypothetical protein